MTRRERIKDPEYGARLIFITTEFDGSRLLIRIKDQGKGFDVAKQKKKSKAELECHGRGLPIMDKVLDELKYSHGGTEVTLVKILPIPADSNGDRSPVKG